MSSHPNDDEVRPPEDEAEQDQAEQDQAEQDQQAAGAEITTTEGGGSTFEPEEDPEGHAG